MEEIKEKELNSISLRFNQAIWMKEIGQQSFSVFGLGNIGSWLTLYLSRIGGHITAVDFDRIEAHNMGGQFFHTNQISMPKASAIKNNCKHFSDFPNSTKGLDSFIIDFGKVDELFELEKAITIGHTYPNYVFSCFDNIKAREILFNSCKDGEVKNVVFIDGRSNVENYQCFLVDMNNAKQVNKYEDEYLSVKDEDIPDAPCNYKSTSHCGSQLASMMVSLMVNHRYNYIMGAEIRKVPFKIIMDLQNFRFEHDTIN